MEIEKKQAFLHIKQSKEGNISVIASDETLDSDGEVIKVAGWDLKSRFAKNPIMLTYHDYNSDPVGTWDVKVEKGKLIADVAKWASTERGEEIKSLVADGILRTVSVGFEVLERDTKDASIITKAKLYEISWVTVPANPNAVVRALAKGYDVKLKKTEEKMKDETLIKHYREVVKEYRKNMKEIKELLNIQISEKDGAEVEEKEQIKTVHEVVTETLKSYLEDAQKAQNELEAEKELETPGLSQDDVISVVKEVMKSELSKIY